MLYNKNIRKQITDALENRVSVIVDYNIALAEQGMLTSKDNSSNLSATLMLIDAFENIDVFSYEQQNNLENLYNKIISVQ